MQVIGAFWGHRPSELYPRVQCPVMLLPARGRESDAGEEHRRWREESVARAEALLPSSKTISLEDSIHDVPLQRPELVSSW